MRSNIDMSQYKNFQYLGVSGTECKKLGDRNLNRILFLKCKVADCDLYDGKRPVIIVAPFDNLACSVLRPVSSNTWIIKYLIQESIALVFELNRPLQE